MTERRVAIPGLDFAAAHAFLGRRAIAGVEHLEDGTYRRTLRHGSAVATLTLRAEPDALTLTVDAPPDTSVDAFVWRARRVFDADADLAAAWAHLGNDPGLAPLIAQRPALRVWGGWDGFELALRAVLGQQVTLGQARTLLGRLVARAGTRRLGAEPGLEAVFPTPKQVLAANLADMGMPAARARTLKSVAEAALADRALFAENAGLDATLAKLTAIRGIGDWSAHYIAMRACRDPDAFPASDVGLLRGAATFLGYRPTPAQLAARAEAWRPWRAYAAAQLWAADPNFAPTAVSPTRP